MAILALAKSELVARFNSILADMPERTEKPAISILERIILGAIAAVLGTGGGYTGLSFANAQQTKEIAAVQTQADEIEKSIESIEKDLKAEIRSLKQAQEVMSDKIDEQAQAQAKVQAKTERSLGKIEGMLEIIIRNSKR